MIQPARFIAADLGASSGRIMAGAWDGKSFSMEEIHRFPNGGIRLSGGLYWDVLGLWAQIRLGLEKYSACCSRTPQGIAVDAWGVDFGLLDRAGRLLGHPRHYRDPRTNGVPQSVFGIVPEREWFHETGVRTMQINTLFQLHSMVSSRDSELHLAATLLMIPDLYTYFLCGAKIAERTEATTTQMYSLRRKDWAGTLLDRVNLPVAILPAVIEPGTALSDISYDVFTECGFAHSFPAIAVSSHDTASAVAAIPDMGLGSVFLASGTWSLMGTEVAEPNVSDAALQQGFTNESGASGAILLLKNMTGLWIIQECMRHWTIEGKNYTWKDLNSAAEVAAPFRSLIDPNATEFQSQCDMPNAVRSYCAATGQAIPHTVGEIVRCVFESLSLNYRVVLEALRGLTNRDLSTIRIVGGAVLNSALCQMTADACHCVVVCGPTEAAALGNVMLQAIAMGHISDVESGRAAIAQSVQCEIFYPNQSDQWDDPYARFHSLETKHNRAGS
jgi:rhamnulokinase